MSYQTTAANVVQVRRARKYWAIYVNGLLAEGGFHTRESAELAARTRYQVAQI